MDGKDRFFARRSGFGDLHFAGQDDIHVVAGFLFQKDDLVLPISFYLEDVLEALELLLGQRGEKRNAADQINLH
jgi:hypothetical protein